MFGFIKKLFSGIAAFLSGLLGGGKKGGYYLELKDDSPAPAAPKAEAPKPEAPKVEAPKAEAPKPEPVAAQATPAPEAPKEKPKVELVQTATGLEAVPAPETNGKITASGTTFAPQYLNPITNSNPRRRPGANMAMYQDMARQVNTPSA